MFALFWNLSAALNGYMRLYMPTNRAVDYLRSRRGLKWAIPVALVATPAYLFAMSVCATILERGGPGYLNLLVMLFAWNAIKFAVMGVVSLPMLLWRSVAFGRSASELRQSGAKVASGPTLSRLSDGFRSVRTSVSTAPNVSPSATGTEMSRR